MAIRTAAVRKAGACDRDKLPVISVCAQSHFQHSIGGKVPDFAGRQWTAEFIEIPASRADHDLPQPWRGDRAFGIHLGEALIIMFVAVEHQFRARLIENLPQSLIICIAPMMSAGRPAWLVPV